MKPFLAIVSLSVCFLPFVTSCSSNNTLRSSVSPSPSIESLSSTSPSTSSVSSGNLENDKNNSSENSLSLSDIDIALKKLYKRRERWLIASKCIRAISAVNGRVKELCGASPDIYNLALNGGVLAAKDIIEGHLHDLDLYESQLEDEIIYKLPDDHPIVLRAMFNAVNNPEVTAAIKDFERNYKPSP